MYALKIETRTRLKRLRNQLRRIPITHSDMPKYIGVDIETSPQPVEQLVTKELKPSFEEPKTKASKSAADKEAEWLGECALKAHLGFILSIGVTESAFSCRFFHGYNEKQILQEFWDFVAGEYPVVLYGHNFKGFDLPFLIRRSFIHQIQPHPAFLPSARGYFSEHAVRDTMVMWACGGRDMISLDHLAKAMGVGKKNGEGKHFASLYAENVEKALEYHTNDMKLTYLVAQRLGLFQA